MYFSVTQFFSTKYARVHLSICLLILFVTYSVAVFQLQNLTYVTERLSSYIDKICLSVYSPSRERYFSNVRLKFPLLYLVIMIPQFAACCLFRHILIFARQGLLLDILKRSSNYAAERFPILILELQDVTANDENFFHCVQCKTLE